MTSNSANYSFATETQIKLEATPAPGYRFVRWSGTRISSAVNPITFNLDCDSTVQAGFDPINPATTVEKRGAGSVFPPPAKYNYPPGTVMTLKATPDQGWKFDGWSANVANPDSPETSLTVGADSVVTARFSRIWPVWMIFGMVIGAMAVIGGTAWFTFKHRRMVKGTFLKLLQSGKTSFAFRLALGSIFIIAGASKITHIQSLVGDIAKYRILPDILGSAFGYTLPYLEILLGIALILGIRRRTSAAVSGLLTLSFVVAKTSAMVRGLDISVCNCFGPAVPLLSTYSLLISFVMLALAAHIVFVRPRGASVRARANLRRGLRVAESIK